MGGLFSSPKPQIDRAAEDRRAAAEAAAAEEQAEIERKNREEKDAIRRGLRGQRSLFSAAGGELGFDTKLGPS